ncbi:MAG: tripartite tricarboxylate transporter substrate binding protein [Casimicrobiaceae bacterium]
MKSRHPAWWAALALLPLCVSVHAEYPERALQVIVPFPAGGVVDSVSRRFSEVLADIVKQPVVVLNKDGASGIIAMDLLANAPPDGYTVAFSPNGPLTIQPSLRKTTYDLKSFRPICQVSVITYVLVVPATSPITNLQQFVARAKSEAGVKLAIGGVGTLPHFASLELQKATSTKFLTVPYRGDPGVTLAVKAGDVDAGVLGVDTALAQEFRIVAAFSPQRLPFLPAAPTAREQGFDVVAASTTGLFAPGRVPSQVAGKLEAACAAITRDARFVAALGQFKQEAAYLPGEQFTAALAADAEEKRKLIEAVGIKQDQ